ncbi:hypothetical protein FRC01_002291 [Tulasnella sp. 417]|nr:hypothetical protein FRC01_002291 [Tulasnella sp. 417]
MAVDMLSGLLLEDAIVHNAVHKAQNTPDKTFFLGMLAGLWITFGGLAGLSAAGGIPIDVRNNWPILPKLGLAIFFPTALHFIVLFGGELFTGNTMIVLIGWLNKKLTLKKMLLNWFIVYIGNFCGCVLFAYLFGYLTQVFEHEPYLSYVQSIAVTKTHYGWGVIFLKGIVANTCVCLGVILGLASRDAAGKILALWFPPVIFVLMGMEHVIANQFFVNIGLMYGADTTIGKMWYNQSAAALGNLVGGALVLGLSEHVMNHWKSPLPWHKDHPRGSLAAHDIESTRRAKETPSQISSSANSIMNIFTGHHGPKIEVTSDPEKDNVTLRPPMASHHFNGTPQMV